MLCCVMMLCSIKSIISPVPTPPFPPIPQSRSPYSIFPKSERVHQRSKHVHFLSHKLRTPESTSIIFLRCALHSALCYRTHSMQTAHLSIPFSPPQALQNYKLCTPQ